jgi:tetrahydromethanopterin S-methyltransferase subunit B
MLKQKSPSNKTRKSPSPKTSPGSMTESKKSINKTKKSPSPPNKSELLKQSAFNIFYQNEPKSLDTLKLFSTSTKYKKQFSNIDETDIKINTLNEKIKNLEEIVAENKRNKQHLQEQFYQLYNVDPITNTITKKNIKKIKNEMKTIDEKIKKMNDDIEKYEIMIEDTEFIRNIWISNKIDGATKQKLVDDYNKFTKVNQPKIDKILKLIEKNKNKTFEKSYPNVAPVFIESPENIPENAVSVGRDMYLINEDAAKFWEFTNKSETEFQKNMNKLNSLNSEMREFKQNILNII